MPTRDQAIPAVFGGAAAGVGGNPAADDTSGGCAEGVMTHLRSAPQVGKGQVTIPKAKAIQAALGLKQGDQLRWDLEDGAVRVRLVTPLDLAYLRGSEAEMVPQRVIR